MLSNSTKMPKAIPAIPRLRALLNTRHFLRNPLGMIGKSLDEYGDTFKTYIGGVYPGIVTINPALIQHVLQKNNRNYCKSPMHFDKLARFLGYGLLTSEGDYWLRQRRLIQPGFHRTRLAALTELMQGVVDEFLVELDKELSKDATLEMSSKMMELAFRIIARALFSTDLDEADLQKTANDITLLQKFLIRQIRQPYLNPWFRVSGKLRRHEQIAQEFEQRVTDIIQRRRNSGERPDDLLQMLLESRYEDNGEGMTDRQLFEECAILFVAGHETSANAMTWMWYLLSKHPEVVERIRQELETTLGERKPGFEDLPKLVYCTQVIEETMRLYPPAWITDRVAMADDEFEGIKIPKGVMMVTYFYGVHHDPHQWPDPERFDPDRFDKERRRQQHPYAYIPFGGGPRLCIGNSFAMMEMQLALAAMIRAYDFELVQEQVIEPQALVTLRPKYGIKCAFGKSAKPYIKSSAP